MKIIEQHGGEFIVRMAKHELEELVLHFIDVDRDKPVLDGEELGDLAKHIDYWLRENGGDGFKGQRDDLLAACEDAFRHYDLSSEILYQAIKKAKGE